MISYFKDAMKHLVVKFKTASIRSMHRMASGWDAQGVLPAMLLPKTEVISKPRGPLQFDFSDRSRKRLGWNHFLARHGH
jgi:hypothetical protein